MADHTDARGMMAGRETFDYLASNMTISGFAMPRLTIAREMEAGLSGPAEGAYFLFLQGGKTYLAEENKVKSLFGAVFRGIQGHCSIPGDPSSFVEPSSPRDVAIKSSNFSEMHRTPHENVLKEISIMDVLSRGNSGHRGGEFIMPCIDACISENWSKLYVVTPWCGRGDLLSNVVRDEGIGEDNARTWFRQVLLALGFIHGKGLCHHDLSPENITITARGDVAVVMDFGMAQRLPIGPQGEVLLTHDGEKFGKTRYMAPEVFRGEAYDGRQADIWAMATTLTLCLGGMYPFDAPSRLPLPQFNILSSDIYRFTLVEDFGARYMLDSLGLPSRLSPAAVELVCDTLIVDRSLRPSLADELVRHAFFEQ